MPHPGGVQRHCRLEADRRQGADPRRLSFVRQPRFGRPLARSVGDCAIADAIMADEPVGGLDPMPPSAIRLGVLQSLVLDDLEPPVARDFERALGRLAAAGLRLDAVAFEAVRRFPLINAKGGLGAAEAYAHHAAQIAARRDGYDPRVVNRILHGAAITAAELIDIHRQRAELIGQFHMAAAGFDALVLPTTPLVAPPLAAIASDEDYVRLNMRSLRNTIIGNFLGVCAISLPMSEAGAPPTGLMLMARAAAATGTCCRWQAPSKPRWRGHREKISIAKIAIELTIATFRHQCYIIPAGENSRRLPGESRRRSDLPPDFRGAGCDSPGIARELATARSTDQ